MAELKNIYPPVINPLNRAGRPLHYSPEELAGKFAEYVAWCDEHPIVITRTAKGSNSSPAGDTTFDRDEEEKKPQYISVKGFLVWLGESVSWWEMLDKDSSSADEFLSVKSYIRAYCEENQSKLASAGIFKENIISRLLGLADKQQVSSPGVTIVVKSEEEKKKIEGIAELDV